MLDSPSSHILTCSSTYSEGLEASSYAPAAMSPPTPDSNDDSESQPLSAASRVFAIIELAEAILSELPPRDLLLSQRTCTSFRDTFQGSIKIMKRLHLLPSTSKVLTLPPLWPNSHIHMWLDCWSNAWVAGKVGRSVIVLEFPGKDEAFLEWLSRESSWQNIHIGSPPVRTGRIIGARFGREYGEELAGIKCERGLTLGDLVDVAGRVQKEFPDVDPIYLRLGVSEGDDGDHHVPKRYLI
ncbi:hypothetical protein AC579_5691 [Pseudocercospora musae]|uniref:F-box domain-containing protein n=1 Tax=Pseudocercospora musae TaxID=113226 RepID=A0A139IRQ0_9PEZI|nr:hypothetical protein AC579_5691 [Pseudocercospora musae]